MMMKAERRSVKWLVITVYSAETAAAHGLSFFLSYQCAAAVKAVFSAAAVTHAVTATTAAVTVAATTVAVATTAVAKLKSKDNLGISGVSFLCENKIIFKVKK